MDTNRIYTEDDMQNSIFERQRYKNPEIKPGIKIANVWVRFWLQFGFYKDKVIDIQKGKNTQVLGKESLIKFLDRHRDTLENYKNTSFSEADVLILKQAFIEYEAKRKRTVVPQAPVTQAPAACQVARIFDKIASISPHMAHTIKNARNISSELQTLGLAISQQPRAIPPKEPDVMVALRQAPSKDAYRQVFAQDACYLNQSEGTKFPGSKNHPSYQINKILQYESGLKMIFLTSDTKGAPPLLAIRGTDKSNVTNIIDDFSHTIGSINLSLHREEVEKTLTQYHQQYGRLEVFGHSFGGAVSELLTAEYPHLFRACTTFNGAGTSVKMVDRFQNNVAQLKDLPPPQITHYRNARDVVSLIGTHLPTEKGHFISVGDPHEKISFLAAHSTNTLLDQRQPRRMGKNVPFRTLKNTAQFANWARTQLSPIAQLCGDFCHESDKLKGILGITANNRTSAAG